MLPKFLWETADKVALAAGDGLAARQAVILPGAGNRVAAALNHLAPRPLLLRMLPHAYPGLRSN